EEPFAYTHFAYKSHWFVLPQTDGADYVPTANPEWNEERALAALNIERAAFERLDGNTQGYAKPGRAIAINPVAALPHKTLFHECGHYADIGITVMSSSATAMKRISPKPRSPLATCGKSKPKPWRFCAASRWLCQAPSSAAATSKTGATA